MNKRYSITCTVLLLFLIWAAISGCGPNYVFLEKHETTEGQWAYEDTIDFKVNISDTLAIYNLYLEVEHSTDYAFQNLYANIYTQFPDGQRLKKLVSFELANKGGIWLGQCSQNFCTLNIPIQQGAFFNEPGEYLFTLEQHMRINPILGVKSFAFRIEETGEQRKF